MTAADPRAIAEQILGDIDWQDGAMGFCRCPGADLHTHKNGKRDCRVILTGAPTVYCLHNSCQGAVDQANHQLRSGIAKGELSGQPFVPTPQDLAKERERRELERLRNRARQSLHYIVTEFSSSPYDLWEASPVRLWGDAEDDWRLLLLRLFDPLDVIWIAPEPKFSAGDEASPEWRNICTQCFRTIKDWLREPEAPGNFVCPSVFWPESCSRSNDNVLSTPYLVVESDILERVPMTGVLNWLQRFLRMRAVVDTGGKSLHGWFDYPSPEHLAELKVILPELGCDRALFKPSQPVRLPGILRSPDRWQHLVFLDAGGGA